VQHLRQHPHVQLQAGKDTFSRAISDEDRFMASTTQRERCGDQRLEVAPGSSSGQDQEAAHSWIMRLLRGLDQCYAPDSVCKNGSHARVSRSAVVGPAPPKMTMLRARRRRERVMTGLEVVGLCGVPLEG